MTSCYSESRVLRRVPWGVRGVTGSGLSGPMVAQAKACMKLWPVISTGSTWGMAARNENGGSG